MKFVAELGIEITMMVSTGYENDQFYLVMDFSCLIAIQYIDQCYFDSYQDDLKDKLIQKFNFELPVTKINVDYDELECC